MSINTLHKGDDDDNNNNNNTKTDNWWRNRKFYISNNLNYTFRCVITLNLANDGLETRIAYACYSTTDLPSVEKERNIRTVLTTLWTERKTLYVFGDVSRSHLVIKKGSIEISVTVTLSSQSLIISV